MNSLPTLNDSVSFRAIINAVQDNWALCNFSDQICIFCQLFWPLEACIQLCFVWPAKDLCCLVARWTFQTRSCFGRPGRTRHSASRAHFPTGAGNHTSLSPSQYCRSQSSACWCRCPRYFASGGALNDSNSPTWPISRNSEDCHPSSLYLNTPPLIPIPFPSIAMPSFLFWPSYDKL